MDPTFGLLDVPCKFVQQIIRHQHIHIYGVYEKINYIIYAHICTIYAIKYRFRYISVYHLQNLFSRLALPRAMPDAVHPLDQL